MEERNQLQFLEDAQSAVKMLDEKKAACANEQKLFQESEKELEVLRKRIEREKETRVRSNRNDVESEYDKQIRKVEAEIGKVESRRQNARNSAVRDRMKAETSGLRAANDSLKSNISGILKKAGLPAFCKSRFFLFMFSPRGLGEVLKMVLVFLVLLVLLPYIISRFFRSTGWQAAAFAVTDLMVIGAYFLISQKVAAPGKEAINLCHDEMDKIIANEKEIRKIERSVKEDKDDSRYGLMEFDADLSRLDQQKNGIVMKKQAALAEFDLQTAEKLRAEVDGAWADQRAKAAAAMTQHGMAVRQYSEEIVSLEQEINAKYTQYLGAKSMTQAALTAQIEEQKQLQAASVPMLTDDAQQKEN